MQRGECRAAGDNNAAVFIARIIALLALLVGGALQAACSVVPVAVYDPLDAPDDVPFPNDQYFIDPATTSGFTADATLDIPASGDQPLLGQVNLLDGFSTVAEARMDIDGLRIDLDSVNDSGAGPADRGIVVMNSTSGVVLEPGVDYRVRRAAVELDDTRLYIQWLRPLAPRNTYAVIVTNRLETKEGLPVEASETFERVRSISPVSTSGSLTVTQADYLERVRQLLQPALMQAESAPPAGPGINRGDIVLAWTFTTQSVGASLQALNATAAPQSLALSATGKNTGDLGLGLDDTADIYTGTMSLPYYLGAPADAQDPLPLFTSWLSDTSVASGNSHLPGAPACSSLSPSENTTACFPRPLLRSIQTVPVMAAVPNANSACAAPPAGGYPVTIFIHGFTRSRADALLVAPALADVCQVVIAIDLPLHGIDPMSPFVAFRDSATGERTFDVDYALTVDDGDGLCLQVPAVPDDIQDDGLPDCSGQHFLNLESLKTGRDNLRQGVIDNIHLLKTVQAGNLPLVDASGAPAGAINVNTGTTHVVGVSLGGVVASTLMGVNNEGTAASISVAGGGVAKLVEGSAVLGPVVTAGLAAQNIVTGTQKYETYIRFAQTLLDSADPINFATQAAANYAIHFTEIVGESGESKPDQVVPNNVPADAPNVITSGPLSGTDPLVRVMGLASVEDVNPELGIPACNAGPDSVVRLTRGDHSSLLRRSESSDTTQEMQAELAAFLGTAGAGFPVNGGGPACP